MYLKPLLCNRYYANTFRSISFVYNIPMESEFSPLDTLGSSGTESKITIYRSVGWRKGAGICIQAPLLHVWHFYHQSVLSVTCPKSHCYWEKMELPSKLRFFTPSLLRMAKNKKSCLVGIVGKKMEEMAWF